MLVLYCLLMMYLSTFFTFLAIVGAGYLICFAAYRVRVCEPASCKPRPWEKRPAYNVDGLDIT